MQDTMQYEVAMKTIDRETFVKLYAVTARGEEQCVSCPQFGTSWSCPPRLPDLKVYTEGFRLVCLVLLKVTYTEALVSASCASAGGAEDIRNYYYEKKRVSFFRKLLELQKKFPESRMLAPGRCGLCAQCSRKSNLPCRHPEQECYAFSAFGMDMERLVQDEFAVNILWEKNGLPEYEVAVAALLIL